VVATFFISLYAAGAVFYGFTTVFEPIANEMGWSYTQISFAASLRGLEMGLLAPLTGVLVDRLGARKLVFGGGIITAAGLLMLRYTTSLGMFYAAFILIAIGMSSCTFNVPMTAVANWFKKKIGIASGIALSGFGFGGILIPTMVKLIDSYGWRTTMVILAVGMLIIVLPLSLLYRRKPEQYGYVLDGEAEGPATAGKLLAPSAVAQVDVKTKQAIRTGAFWIMTLAFTAHMVVVQAVITHVMPYLSSIGIARATSGLVASGVPLVSIAGRLGLGWLGDKMDRRLVAAGCLAMMGLGLLCFGCASSVGIWLLVPFLIFFGVGYGGSNTQRTSLPREYFGRASFGTLFGLMTGINTLGSIVGPPLAGWAFDTWGSYQGIWYILAGLPLLAMMAMLSMPKPASGPQQTR